MRWNARALVWAVAIQTVATAGCEEEWTDEASMEALARTPIRSVDDLVARKAAIRHSVLDATGVDLAGSRKMTEVARRPLFARPGYAVEGLALEVAPGFLLTANVYRPEGAGPHPAVVHFHGHVAHNGRLARMHPAIQTLSATLAGAGAIVVVVDMVGWGESLQVDHGDHGVLALQLWNGISTVSWLEQQPDVDPTRIAAIGESGGGSQALFLSTVDVRVSALATIAMISAVNQGGDNCEVGLPIRAEAETNNAEMAAAFAPGAQLVVSDGHDWTRTVPRVELPWMRDIYALVGAEAKLSGVHLEAESHDLGPSKRAAVYRFLAEQLGLAVPDEEADVEPDDALAVFDEESPRPAVRALTADEVRKSLRATGQ